MAAEAGATALQPLASQTKRLAAALATLGDPLSAEVMAAWNAVYRPLRESRINEFSPAN